MSHILRFGGARARALIVIAAMLATAASMAACSSGSSVKSGTAATSAQVNSTTTPVPSTPLPQPTATPANLYKTVGQTLELYSDDRSTDIKAVAVSVHTSTGWDYDTPQNGHIFVVVNLSLNNAGTQDYDYNPLDFYFMTTEGNLIDAGSHIGDSKSLDFGTLAPGGTVSGDLIFEVPSSQVKGGKMTWQADYSLPKSKYGWDLGL